MTDDTGSSGWPAPPIEKQRAALRGTDDTLTPEQALDREIEIEEACQRRFTALREQLRKVHNLSSVRLKVTRRYRRRNAALREQLREAERQLREAQR